MKTKYPPKPKKFSRKQKEKKTLRQAAFSHVSPIQRKCMAVLLLMFLFNAAFVGRIFRVERSDSKKLLADLQARWG